MTFGPQQSLGMSAAGMARIPAERRVLIRSVSLGAVLLALVFALFLPARASAVSYDYCGIARYSSDACWAASNSNIVTEYYRYNEGHTAGYQTVANMCSFLRTPPPGNNDRAGSGCWANFSYHIINRCDDFPDTRAFIYVWDQPGGPFTLYGHADNAYRSNCS
jgi:hypothetical protein